MKRLFSLFAFSLIVGMVSLSAQNFKYTIKTSEECTNLTAEFTVPAGKTAAIVNLTLVPKYFNCASPQVETDMNFAQVMKKTTSSKGSSNSSLVYKKVVFKNGDVKESTAMSSVVLKSGTYIFEYCPAPNAEATLEIKLSSN